MLNKMTPEEAIEKIKWTMQNNSHNKELCDICIEALKKQILKKPTYVDTRFRHHGRHISDGVSVDKCYQCPTCGSHIFHIWDSDTNCSHCGQALDWSDE